MDPEQLLEHRPPRSVSGFASKLVISRACGDALADLRGDVLDEGPQRVGVGRRDEEEGAEAEVKREVRQDLDPVVGRPDDRLVGVAWPARAPCAVNAPDML